MLHERFFIIFTVVLKKSFVCGRRIRMMRIRYKSIHFWECFTYKKQLTFKFAVNFNLQYADFLFCTLKVFYLKIHNLLFTTFWLIIILQTCNFIFWNVRFMAFNFYFAISMFLIAQYMIFTFAIFEFTSRDEPTCESFSPISIFLLHIALGGDKNYKFAGKAYFTRRCTELRK